MDEKLDEVQFNPIFDEPREIQNYIDYHGFDDYDKFTVYDDYCSIIFHNPKRANDFYNFINGKVVNEKKIKAQLTDSTANLQTPPNSQPGQIHSRTISVSSTVSLNDRQLYMLFKHCGFIRHVESHSSYGYVEFDTEDDALYAIQKMNQYPVDSDQKVVLTVIQVMDRMLNVPNVVIPLAVIEKEEPPPPRHPIEQRRSKGHDHRDDHSGHRSRHRYH